MDEGKMNKRRGQLTVFIIVGIMIVVLGILIYLFYPQISSTLGFGGEPKSPSAEIQDCLEPTLKENVDLISSQGGELSPTHYFSYKGNQVQYLCYTNEYYKRCVNQQPMLKKHVEKEILDSISAKAKECFNSMKESYKKKGYSVNTKEGELSVELLPKRIVVNFDSTMTLSKAGSTENYESFRVMLTNNLYELVSITGSILNAEASLGDFETTTYMNYYHDLQVEKLLHTDGTKIIILTDLNNRNKFQFASRSVAWPPGYGITEQLKNAR